MRETIPLLSKSNFIKGEQCHKALYLQIHNPYLRDRPDADRLAKFKRGNKVGKLAQQLFPGGTDLSRYLFKGIATMAAETTLELQKGTSVLYEACFENGSAACIVDIAVKENDCWHFYEVKSAARIAGHHIQDASFQYTVIRSSGINIGTFNLVFLDKSYTFINKLEIKKLFKITNVTETAKSKYDTIVQKIQELNALLTIDKVPNIKTGSHCFAPYDCDFLSQCWQKPYYDYSIFQLAEASPSQKFEFFQKGINELAKIPISPTLTHWQKIQIECAKNNTEYINKKEVSEFVMRLGKNTAFVDTESFMPAVPIFQNTKVYEHIAFCFVVHTTQNGFYSFFSEGETNPSEAFLRQFIESIKLSETIVVFDKTSEMKVLNKLKHEFPLYTKEIEKCETKIVDLFSLFKNFSYYHPGMKGSLNLKSIANAMLDINPYPANRVDDGLSASIAYEYYLQPEDLFQAAAIKEDIITYCKADVQAMISIVEKLKNVLLNYIKYPIS